MSRYQKGKTRKVKTSLDLLEQEIVSGSGICWAICIAYSLRPPARSPSAWQHMGSPHPHSAHPESSSLHGAVKAGSLSEIERRALPPPCFPSFIFQSTRSQRAHVQLFETHIFQTCPINFSHSNVNTVLIADFTPLQCTTTH